VSLRKLQEELASLLLEEPSRRSFARGRTRHVRGRGLRGKEATLLASLDADDVAYFAARRAADRRSALAADLPRTYQALDEAGKLPAYFRAHPYALEDPLREAARAAGWCARPEGARVPAWIADLAAFEHAHLALLAKPFRAARASRRPRRAPGVVLLRLGHDLAPALSRGRGGRSRATYAALVRRPGDVEAGEIPALDFHVLRAADGRRTDAQVLAAAARRASATEPKARASLRRLQRDGWLCPTSPRTRRAAGSAPTRPRARSSRSAGGRGPRRS
jgi:hypothetical protein